MSKYSAILVSVALCAVVGTLYVAMPASYSLQTLGVSTAANTKGFSTKAHHTHGDDRKNMLFIMADDFRPQSGNFYKDKYGFMSTPGLDKLSSDAFVANRFTVQVAWCCPSRSSMLTSRRPFTTEVTEFEHFRAAMPDVTTIPGHFKSNGYTTIGGGKIFHNVFGDEAFDPMSWHEEFWEPINYDMYQGGPSWRAMSAEEIEEYPLPDMDLVTWAKDHLDEFAETGENFFLAVGFYKPHLPLVFPEEFLDLYPEDSFETRPLTAPLKWVPEDYPELPYGGFPELRAFDDIDADGTFNTTVPDEKANELRRAYYAAVSYTDSLILDLLEHLEMLGLDENTVISFMGDHGWHLGEHAEWEKQTNYNIATNAPLIIRPAGGLSHKIESHALLEAVDIMPTLAELTGIPRVPECPVYWKESQEVSLCTEGQSIVPLMIDPERPWKQAVFSQFEKMKYYTMGFSMRTDDFHMVDWVYFDFGNNEANFDLRYAVELYDLRVDADENYNVANSEDYADILEGLSEIMREGYSSQRIEVDQDGSEYGVHDFHGAGSMGSS